MFDEIAQIVFKLYQLCDNVRRNKYVALSLFDPLQLKIPFVEMMPNN